MLAAQAEQATHPRQKKLSCPSSNWSQMTSWRNQKLNNSDALKLHASPESYNPDGGSRSYATEQGRTAQNPRRLPSPTIMHALVWATFVVASQQENPHLLFMGWAGAGGSGFEMAEMWLWLADSLYAHLGRG